MTPNARRIQIFDTTLRDGAQTAGINFSAEDKVRIASQLAEFGIDWIEGGWPGASPKDDHFFELMRDRNWSHARLVAFGSTARPGGRADTDTGLQRLIDSGADAACIFGKAWGLHVTKALRISLQENVDLVHNSVSYLKQHFPTVFFDAEHFFDGYGADEKYTLQVLEAAYAAGADALVLCDTNGGNVPYRVAQVVTAMCERFADTVIGIHAHNDCELAVANSLAAARVGARQIQGTINGIGERCGNANLVSIIPNLRLKMGLDCGIDAEHMKELRTLSDFVNEMANRLPWRHQPYVGLNAFAHKGGIHVSAIRKASELYEHIPPETVGNRQRVLVSDQAGRSNILFKLGEMDLGMRVDPEDPAVAEVVRRIKQMEDQGYAYEGAEASFHLLVLKAMQQFEHYFELEGFRVIDEKHGHEGEPQSEATVMVAVGGKFAHTASLGNGPVNAMDNALRRALSDFYPTLSELWLTDFKVRVLSTKAATRAAVRVLIESTDGVRKWGTVGVSTNMIDASYQALVDAIEYKLVLDRVPPPSTAD
ncbi:MAG: citramalate synthase [Mariprofundaceae bacterium]|nr:citramalate synthase [Mariprofundaceae bacterium]